MEIDSSELGSGAPAASGTPHAGAVVEATPATEVRREARPGDDADAVQRPEPLYDVVLIDDDEHTYEYVVSMVCTLFGRTPEQGYQVAVEVDRTGRAIVDTTHRERAELKRDQILAFGADPLLRNSTGSMRATIEPRGA